jgi:hypothetical protein
MIRYLKLPMLASSLVLAVCAINPANAQSTAPERTAEVDRACAQTMGLNPANADYDMCSIRLLRTLARLDQAKLVQDDRQACMQRGLQPGSSDFAVCVVDAETPVSN